MTQALVTKEQLAFDILRAARIRLSDQSRWTKDHLARDNDAQSICPTSDQAVCWSMVGAIEAEDSLPDVRKQAISFLYKGASTIMVLEENTTTPAVEIVEFNDDPDTTHEYVMLAFDRAIELAEATAISQPETLDTKIAQLSDQLATAQAQIAELTALLGSAGVKQLMTVSMENRS